MIEALLPNIATAPMSLIRHGASFKALANGLPNADAISVAAGMP